MMTTDDLKENRFKILEDILSNNDTLRTIQSFLGVLKDDYYNNIDINHISSLDTIREKFELIFDVELWDNDTFDIVFRVDGFNYKMEEKVRILDVFDVEDFDGVVSGIGLNIIK